MRNLFRLVLVLALALSAAAQTGTSGTTFFTVTAASGISLTNTGIAYHTLTWLTSGTVSTCTVALDTSADGVSWSAGGAITGQTCTANGGTGFVKSSANFVRINVTVLSGGGNVNVTWNGYITPPAAVVSTSGQGYLFAPTVFIPAAAGTDALAGSANSVRAFQFILPYTITISKVSINVTTADAVNTVADVGIYDANKNRVAFTTGGISVATTGVKQVNLTSAVTLPPGVYYFATTSNSGTAAGTATASAGNVGSPLVQVAWGVASVAAAAGVLPTTLGTITNNGANPVCAKFEP